MKNSFVFMVIILSAILLVSGNGKVSAQAERPWKELKEAYAAYLKGPAEKAVDAVCAAISDCKNAPPETPISAYVMSPGARAQEDTDDFIMAHLDVPKRRMREGDRASFRLVFHLLTISDAAFTEDLNEILDLPIHRDPKLFLEEMKDNRKLLEPVGGLEEILTFMGTAFADQGGRPQEEYRHRIRDLKKVTQPDLRAIRDECIKILESEIHKNDQSDH